MPSLLYQLTQQLSPLGPSAAQQASWVLEHVLGLSRTQLAAQPNPPLRPEQEREIAAISARLLRQEPLQYVLEEAYFYGYCFRANPAVLIPRPETEELVHRIIERHKPAPTLRVLDLCTGSGCIGLTLAKELPQAKVSATDVSAEALRVAKINAELLEVDAAFRQHDVLNEPLEGSWEVVVSNPPYVRPSEKAQMQPNVLDWEPHLALFIPEEDPLLFYRSIAQKARRVLVPGGWLYFEINEAYGRQTAEMLQQAGYQGVRILADMQGRERMAEARWQGGEF